MIGTSELLLILLVVLLMFGGKKLPELARNLGRGVNAFKKELRDVQKTIEESEKQSPPAPTADTTTQSLPQVQQNSEKERLG